MGYGAVGDAVAKIFRQRRDEYRKIILPYLEGRIPLIRPSEFEQVLSGPAGDIRDIEKNYENPDFDRFHGLRSTFGTLSIGVFDCYTLDEIEVKTIPQLIEDAVTGRNREIFFELGFQINLKSTLEDWKAGLTRHDSTFLLHHDLPDTLYKVKYTFNNSGAGIDGYENKVHTSGTMKDVFLRRNPATKKRSA